MLIFCDLQVLECLTCGHTRLSLSFVAFLRTTLRIYAESAVTHEAWAVGQLAVLPGEVGDPAQGGTRHTPVGDSTPDRVGQERGGPTPTPGAAERASLLEQGRSSRHALSGQEKTMVPPLPRRRPMARTPRWSTTRAGEKAALTPARSDRNQRRQLEELVSWTAGERLRSLWYRFRTAVVEIHYANCLMLDCRIAPPPGDLANLPAIGTEPRRG